MFESHSRENTLDLGFKIGKAVKGGRVISLHGKLGAGKTTLAQGIALGLGIEEVVLSPSYVLIAEYNGIMPLYHMDLYRLSGEDEFIALGAEEYFDRKGVCVIEWGERIENLLPADHITVSITITGPTSREYQIEGLEL